MKNTRHKKVKSIIAIPVVILLTISIISGILYWNTDSVQARATLPGIEKLVLNNSNSDPFVILEVVPEKSDARLGYLVGGEEPADESGRAISDMPSRKERVEKLGAVTADSFPDGVGSIGAFTFTTGYGEMDNSTESSDSTGTPDSADSTGLTEPASTGTMKIYGTFQDVGNNNGDYEKTGEGEIYKNDPELVRDAMDPTNLGVLYQQYVYYSIDETTGSCCPKLVKHSGTVGEKYRVTWDENLSQAYLTQYFGVKSIADISEAAVGDVIYKSASGSDELVFDQIILGGTSQNSMTGGSVTVVSPVVTGQVSPSVSPETSPTATPETGETDAGVTPTAGTDEDITPTTGTGEDTTPTTGAGEEVTPTTGILETQDSAVTGMSAQPVPAASAVFVQSVEIDEPEQLYVVTELENPSNYTEGDIYVIGGVSTTDRSYKQETVYKQVPVNADGVYGDEIAEADITAGYYYVKTNAPEFTYVGTGKGNYSFLEDRTMGEVDSFTYENGFQNNEWLKKMVFDLEDDQLPDMVIDVVTVTMEELNSYDLSGVDLIYFAKGDYTAAGTANTILEATAWAIVNAALNNSLPVILNRSVFEAAAPVGDTEPQTSTDGSLLKLCTTLMQDNLQGKSIDDLKTLWDNNPQSTENSQGGVNYYKALKNSMKAPSDTGKLSYVNENVFVYDDTDYAGTGSTMLVSNSFDTAFDSTETEYGFQAVLDEITSENFYLKNAGKEERIEEKASNATAIRYIINYGNQRTAVKSSLNILDIEPYDSSAYYQDGTIRQGMVASKGSGVTIDSIATDSILIMDGAWSKSWVVQNVATNLADKQDVISIDMMGTHEFVGKLEDLNANYDMIYLGMDTSIMNTKMDNGVKTNETVYNDSNMDGLVYTHVGDTVVTGNKMSGTYRLSGNDITIEKKRNLTEYVEAGYALLVSDQFFNKDAGGNITGINEDKVDVSSNMYAFIKDTVLKKNGDQYVYLGDNVNTKEMIENNQGEIRARFVKHINLAKLIVNYSEENMPPAYNKDGTQQYLPANDTGDYPIEFEFSLENDAAVDIGNTTYNCGLYFDLDADGRFETIEEQSGLTIMRSNGGEWIEEYSDSEDHYRLRAGYTYHVTKIIPSDYTGLISWKIIFSQNGEDGASTEQKASSALIRKEISGFCAVAAPENVPTIKVLQIWSKGTQSKGNTFNLSDTAMQAIYSQIKDFKIEVELIRVEDYIKKTNFGSKDYYDYLCDYNMIVMGFTDMYSFTGDDTACKNAVLAIRQYVVSGRSILFTHDLNSFYFNNGSQWGYYINRYLRDVQGMDRFGTLKDDAVLSDAKYQYESVFDTALLKGTSQETRGFSEPNLMEYGYQKNDYSLTARNATYTYSNSHTGSGGNYNTGKKATVSMVNEGQITQYPFLITEGDNDTFTVSHTHPQYLQLNLDTDSQDGNENDDIVVWYTISGYDKVDSDTIFKADQMDVRNNYYIYNKGNVTYTGSGDAAVNEDMERKLFANTLVASYNAGIHAPSVIYKQNQWDSSANITGLYIPYDPQITLKSSLNDQKVTMIFKTLNNNLLNSTAPLYAKYYVEVKKEQATVQIGSHYLKEVTPEAGSFQKINHSEQGNTTQTADSYLLSNYTMYTMQFNRAELGLMSEGGISRDNTVDFYVRLSTQPLVEGTVLAGLPAEESLNKLDVVYTELMDLE